MRISVAVILVTSLGIGFGPVSAQAPTEKLIFDGTKLGDELDMGVNTSGGRTDWVGPDGGAMKMAYPAGQAWGAVFITVGKPKDPPRPGWDLSAFATLLVEVRGDAGSTIEIGIKDANMPDDGTEQKVIVPVFNSYRTYAIPLSKFNRANLKNIYVAAEFVFSGGQQTVWFRNIRYTSAFAPNVENVVNAASFRPGAGAGAWVSLTGQALSPVTRPWADRDFQGNKLPRALDGVTMNVDDRDMALSYVSPTQINALIYGDVITGRSSYVSVTNAVGTSIPLRIIIQPTYPAFFALSPQSGRYAAAVHLDGTIVGKPGLYGGDLTTRPAKPGDLVQIFGTGFGPTSPMTAPDELVPAPVPLPTSANVSVRFGTTPATVDFAGLVGPGLYQFNVRIPNVSDGDQRLSVDLGNVSMQQEVYLTVQR